MPSTKRPNDDSLDGTPIASKYQRTESNNGDFSGAVKKKLSGASRTGQACDRCKVRKIRCDARTGGCSPCLQNNTECRTTDRITGRATSRGYTENIEAENSTLKQRLADLRRQLQEHGIEPRAAPLVSAHTAYESDHVAQTHLSPAERPFSLAHILNQGDSPLTSRAKSSALPEFKSDDVGDNYLGVSSVNDWPLPITGTHHALFGMHLDLKDFAPIDASDRTAALSYRGFHQFVVQRTRPDEPRLPPHQQLRSLCGWFFKQLNPWLPILHKPTFFNLLDRMNQDETFTPSMNEKIQLHLVVAQMLFQYTSRNGMFYDNDFLKHYHYVLSFLDQIFADTSLEGLQSWALMATFMRSFPRPGAAWMFSTSGIMQAVEMGLHRSISAWDNVNNKPDPHQAEMRKRIFWSLLSCHVMVGAKLGRPLCIRLEDFDVELPKPIFDNVPGEKHDSDWDKCSFRAGIYVFESLVFQMQIYTSIYIVRPTSQLPYEDQVKRLYEDLQTWYHSLPQELHSANLSGSAKVQALYMDHIYEHMRLMLHHPALCRTPNVELTTRNLDICLEASSRLLAVGADLRVLKSLDTTWHNSTIFLAAIFTTLFAYLERKDQITSADLTSLGKSMDEWLEIMNDIGQLLGSGTLLKNALGQIIDSALSSVRKHLAAKTASAAVASSAISHAPSVQSSIEQTQDQTSYHAAPTYFESYPHQQSGGPGEGTPSYLAQSDTGVPGQQPPSHNPAVYAYPEPAHTAMAPYGNNSMPFDTNAYNEDMKPDLTAQLAAHNAAMSHPQSSTPQPQPQQQQSYSPFYGYPNGSSTPQPHLHQQTGSIAWRHFADNMVNTMSPHWSANALMALQGQQHQQNPSANGTPVKGGSPAVDGAELNGSAATSSMGLDGHVDNGTGFDMGSHPGHWPLIYER